MGAKASEVAVLAEKWVYGGETLARLDGRVVFAPFLLPGETARLSVGEDVHAELIEVIAPSAERVPPVSSVREMRGMPLSARPL